MMKVCAMLWKHGKIMLFLLTFLFVLTACGGGGGGGGVENDNEPPPMDDNMDDNMDDPDPIVPEPLDDFYTASAIVAGGSYNCALLNDDGGLKCWGGNSEGQLGQDDKEIRGDGVVGTTTDPAVEMGDSLPAIDLGTGLTALEIAGRNQHTCALLTDAADANSVKCWGKGSRGRLGQNSTDNIGDGVGVSVALTPAIRLGTGLTATAIAVGRYHSCALLDDSSVKCWGDSDRGQLGLGDTETRGDGLDTAGVAADEMGDSLPAINLGTGLTATAIAAGEFHTCALLTDGTANSVKCWGAGAEGQLGQGDDDNRGTGAGVSVANTPAIDLGINENDPDDPDDNVPYTAIRIATGLSHTCALLTDGTANSVKCWGLNTNGQLGQNDEDNRGNGIGASVADTPAIELGTGRSATAIVLGSYHTCALLDDNSVKCWGLNTEGQLGQDDTEIRGDGVVGLTTVAADEMGDNLDFIELGRLP